MTYSYTVFLDFDNDGFAGSDDISAYVKSIDTDQGIQDDQSQVASVGHCTLTLQNSSRIFSPSNSSGTYYGKLLPGKAVRVQVTDGSTYTVFRGVIAKITVQPSINGSLEATFECVDAMDRLNNYQINLPLQQSRRSDTLIGKIVAAAFAAATATDTITLSANPSDGDTVGFTMSDGITNLTYTFKTAISAIGHILIGATAIATIDNLIAAINNDSGSGTTYYAGTSRGGEFTGARTAGEVLTCTDGGNTLAIGNAAGTTYQEAQSFTPSVGGVLLQFTFTLVANAGSPSGTMTWEIRNDAGGTSGPGNTVYNTGTLTPVASSTNTVTVSSGATLSAGNKYWLVLKSTGAQSSGNYWQWDESATGTFVGGNEAYSTNGGTSYSDRASYDTHFSVTVAAGATVTAVSPGAWGNNIAVAKSGANITLGGATFSGGVNEPSGLTSYQTGKYTFDYAGDTWQGEQTSAYGAIQEVTASENGLFFIQRDGTVTFWNRDEIFARVTTASSVTISSEHQELVGAEDVEDIYNRIEVEYKPRTTLASGVVAQANSPILVPGQSGATRWNGTVVLPGGGNTIVKLPFTDPTTGKPMGAKSIVTPLVATTDWTANEKSDGTGPDYTGNSNLSFSLAINGDSIEVSISNTALGPLYITMLKVRGVGIVNYQPVVIARENSTSISTYGKRVLTHSLPLAFSGVDSFADSLAIYTLSRYKDAAYRLKNVGFRNFYTVSSTSLFSLKIGDMVTITDYQAVVASLKHMIVGLSYHISGLNITHVLFYLKRMDDVTYWILQDSTYGVLGTSTRLAI